MNANNLIKTMASPQKIWGPEEDEIFSKCLSGGGTIEISMCLGRT